MIWAHGAAVQLEGMARHHQVEVRAGKTRQWAQMAAFKLYEHGTNVTLKRVVNMSLHFVDGAFVDQRSVCSERDKTVNMWT